MGDRASINASYGGRQSGLDGEAIMASMGGAGGGGAPVITYSVSTSASKSFTTGAYIFQILRSGGVSASSVCNFSVGPSGLADRSPAIPADFGGTYPSGSMTFLPGETVKTVSITPASNASPE